MLALAVVAVTEEAMLACTSKLPCERRPKCDGLGLYLSFSFWFLQFFKVLDDFFTFVFFVELIWNLLANWFWPFFTDGTPRVD